ncbi:MAG: capsular biosynthesis protein [Comamonadaceae bacterium]|nr:MAG: capsular biosynthesis protein [Comamonadaceae bacterium]
MIDLHTHILPGIDDGAKDLSVSLAMARIAVEDGITHMACTPHIYPGMYMNDAQGIKQAAAALQAHLDQAGIALRLTTGADVHLVPGLLAGLRNGSVPTLAGSRYVLLEPSHHVAPPRFEESVFELVAAGYTPVITHPERLTWVESHYPVFVRMIGQGCWMQVTAGALTGMFGPRAKYWGERFLAEGHTHIIASDAHSSTRRVPRMSQARDIAEKYLGKEEAHRLVRERPEAIWRNLPPASVAPLPRIKPPGGWLSKILPGKWLRALSD